MPDPRALRVFISSTFADLQAEREHLMKKVFPEIRSVCRERGVDLTEIDLRWGVTREEAEAFGIVRVCLDEIERCRPYFIGILGSRYGWIPPESERARAGSLLADYPWLDEALAERASITEIEILHGALRERERVRAGLVRFYFRGSADSSDESDSSDNTARLARLKDRIRSSGCPVREGFLDAETLGRQVREDLLAFIHTRFPEGEGLTPLDRERRRHEAFASSRRRAYVAKADLVAALDAHAEGDAPPLVVAADSGAGKSALLAHWAARYRGAHPEAFVVEHYVGAADNDPIGLVRRIMEEIRARLSSARELPSTPEATVRDFPLWLAEVQSEPLHLIVDAANQLHESGAPLSWLPKFIPARVRLVVSTTPGSALNELEARGWSRLHVAPLDRAGRAALIESYLTKSRKRLEPELAARLAADERCAVPLFLCTILEELRLFGRHREIGTWIERLLRARDLGALFEKVLERLEADQGREAVGAMLSTLWASRAGLFEEEIIAITRLSRLARSRLALGLDEHLLRLDGRLIFFHEYLRQAARRRYAPTPETAREAHSRIADYFEGHGSPDRRASELPWQLREIEDWERLKSAASDVGILIEHASRHAWFELLGYWIAAGGLEEMESRYDARLAASIVEGGNDEEQAEALVALSDLFDFSGKYAASARVGERGVAIMEKTVGERHPELGRALSSLGWAELREGRYVDAERHTRRAIAIRESALGAAHPSVARSLDVLASVFWATGNFAESEKHHLRAFAIREATLGSAHPELALSLNNLANDCYCTGRYPEAEEHYRRALQIRRAAFGPAHPDVAASLHDLACVFHATGRYAEAEEHFRRALSIIGRRLVRTLRLWRCC